MRGNSHVRFGERGNETCPGNMARRVIPTLPAPERTSPSPPTTFEGRGCKSKHLIYCSLKCLLPPPPLSCYYWQSRSHSPRLPLPQMTPRAQGHGVRWSLPTSACRVRQDRSTHSSGPIISTETMIWQPEQVFPVALSATPRSVRRISSCAIRLPSPPSRSSMLRRPASPIRGCVRS